jgi:hypothetical protein
MKKDQISGAFWLFVSLIIVWQALEVKVGNYRVPGPGFIPLCVGLSMAVISITVILKATFLPNRQKLTLWLSRQATKRIGIVLGGMFLFSILFMNLGFPLSTLFLLILLFKGFEPQRWRVVIPLAIGLTVLTYLLFSVLLKCELPKGLLGI